MDKKNFWQDYDLVYIAKTDSTQDLAKQYHKEMGGTPSARKKIFLADHQTKGYGRHGRAWLDSGEEGRGNFFFSLYLPNMNHAREYATLGLLAGLCLWRAMVHFMTEGEDDLLLKWPNDILWRGKKIAGILIEKIDSAMIIGIGINIHSSPDEKLFAKFCDVITAPPDNKKLAKVFLEKLAGDLPAWQEQGFAPFQKVYQQHGIKQGTAIAITDPHSKNKIHGIYEGITHEGQAIIVVAGVKKFFAVGDIVI